ncbi:uncharacterized protein LOC135142883 isoform X2 [Zophobas morio]|uniref:uncharacterized protein LOC135142883 isoform X2 n=1 Tax=Zophobas morio TaxID=2755281 RepID=UPI0030829696
MSDAAVPQWKKDLIARLRSQNKRTAHAEQQLFGPSHRTLPPPSAAVAVGSEACECGGTMVQRGDKSDSDEDLHYGPGIVSKLKERYLSLAQREKPRPSILRKAASLENLLDDGPAESSRLFQASQNKRVPSRYAQKGPELKRARSVETISTPEETDTKPKRESMHEEMLIKGSLIIPEKPPENEHKYRVNRPKRIAPVMNEKEKPPADVVKQAKMIFERRPEQRTKPPQQTGEVAAKVQTYKRIIVENKPPKKPAIKVKPVLDKPKTNGIRAKNKHGDREASKSPDIPPRARSPEKKVEVLRPKSPEDVPPSPKSPRSPELKLSSDVPSPKSTSLPSPIPDISRVDFKPEENGVKATSLSETPDLIITSSPLPVVDSPSFRISATENFIKEEIRLSETERTPPPPSPKPAKKPQPSPPPTTNSMTYNFVENHAAKSQTQQPINKNVLNTQTPPSQPLKLEINGVSETSSKAKKSSNDLLSAKPTPTNLEIEKNLKNAAKTLQQPKTSSSVITKCDANEVTTIKVPKVKKPPREHENTTMLFDFRDRKDVPDHVKNDGVTRAAKLEKPKVGEGGIILIPGAWVGESFTDEDEEVLRSLEGPPSPCDVTFINDNILIDGKSSLSQKTKKAKLKISFVDEGPEVYEYPSETSLLIEDIPKSPPVAQIRHSVPSLSVSKIM